MEKVLITGASGLIGKHFTSLLLQEGHQVMHLSRKANPNTTTKTFEWNPEKNFIDEEALFEADHIVHLAGATVAKYWTARYKKELMDSRVKSAELIFDCLSRRVNKVKSFISSSAVGYYGDGGENWLHEEDKAGTDYLAEICVHWEAAAKKFEVLNKRVIMIRTGIVLAKDGGPLPPLMQPILFGVAPIFGNGKQFYPWIHIEDLCRIFLFAISNESLHGAYNAVAPDPARFKELMNAIARVAEKRKLNFPLPPFLLKLFLDGFGSSLLRSLRCSSEKIEAAGFHFKHRELDEALKDVNTLETL
jgi:uncharacterized protein (TIGR01777 family)